MFDAHLYPILRVLHSSTEGTNPLSTRYRDSYLMTPTAPELQPPCGRKRRRGVTEEEHLTIAATSPQPPWKRAKRPFQSRQEADAKYWDSLSEIRVTPGALKQLDQRNRRKASFVRTGLIRRPDRGGELAALKNCLPQLKRFARHGGPDLRDLRGYPESGIANSIAHAMPSNQSTSRTQSKSTNTLGESTAKTTHRRTSAYHGDFEQHLIDHRIYPSDYDFPDDRVAPIPNNWKDINDRINEPRPSLSPSRFSDGEFKKFVRANAQASTEAMVMRKPFPIISGDANIPSAGELLFGNLEPLTDGTIVDAKPDFYDGARPAQIDRRIRGELGPYITPSTQQQVPALPNLFAEAKGPDGSAAVSKRQACYNGALGARGIHELRSFGIDATTAYDNNAYTITSTYHDGQLKMYTTHPEPSTDPESSIEYHMTQLGGWALTGSSGQFRQGASAFRNARDWAKERRNELIATANDRVIGNTREASTLESSDLSMLSQSTIEPVALESETSADEVAQDMSEGPRLSQGRLKRGQEKRHSRTDSRKRKKGYSRADGRPGSSVR